MKKIMLMVIFPLIFLAGCCGLSESSSCPLGTYGSACSDVCAKLSQVEGCFSKCLDEVRKEGLGDATTCCKKTFNDWCKELCADNILTSGECISECKRQYQEFGISPDSCYLPL